jgi:phospholipid/cholesterol/gamma-HCH transport system ATP-binding protein
MSETQTTGTPSTPGAPASPAPTPSEAAAELRGALNGVLSSDAPIVARLSYARTSVRFAIDGSQEGVTLLLDRRPPELGDADEPAEIEVTLTPEQGRELAAGRLPLPSAIVRGLVRTRGPVRRYLEVDPIVRGMLGARSGHHDSAVARSNGDGPEMMVSGGPDPELLAIETRDVHKSFGSHQVLRGADLKIPEGVVSVVLGPSGTGKSVLLSQILSLRTEVGVMFQDGALFSTMNLYDNVAFPLRQHTKLNERQIREVVQERLDAVGLGEAAGKMPNELSGGMRKRAGLARALVLDPGVLLCDEPDSGLDPVRTALLGVLLLEQHAQIGGTIVVITHNVLLARSISDHISILWKGKVIEADMTEVILQSGTEFVQQFLKGETRGPLGMD